MYLDKYLNIDFSLNRESNMQLNQFNLSIPKYFGENLKPYFFTSICCVILNQPAGFTINSSVLEQFLWDGFLE